MKQLAELMKSVTPLREYSKGVALAMAEVMMYMDHNIKEEVLDKLAEALCKLNELVAHIFRQIWGKSRKLTFRRPKKSSKR